ncbi:hypothetical protein FE392_07035 [Xenorhabdus sp. 12]|uniref:Secreted protein n=1 Tax=Xenorhabdus santafensis TaxID=2582833 RepID=A0ABU4S8J5_9GAMM|nr:hypothetical protein [Xenorhabdus sp. 12]
MFIPFVFQAASLLAVLIHPSHIVIYAPGDYGRLLPLARGQPLAVQIRSRRICHALAAATQLEIHWVYIVFVDIRMHVGMEEYLAATFSGYPNYDCYLSHEVQH